MFRFECHLKRAPQAIPFPTAGPEPLPFGPEPPPDSVWRLFVSYRGTGSIFVVVLDVTYTIFTQIWYLVRYHTSEIAKAVAL